MDFKGVQGKLPNFEKVVFQGKTSSEVHDYFKDQNESRSLWRMFFFGVAGIVCVAAACFNKKYPGVCENIFWGAACILFWYAVGNLFQAGGSGIDEQEEEFSGSVDPEYLEFKYSMKGVRVIQVEETFVVMVFNHQILSITKDLFASEDDWRKVVRFANWKQRELSKQGATQM